MNCFKISKNIIRKYGAPYIIAEIGSNHNGNMKLCKQHILSAKKSGAHAVKFQKFNEKSLFSEQSYKIKGLKKKDVKQFTLSIKQLKNISIFCKKTGIDFGVTPFSLSELKEIEKNMKVDFYKVASGDLNFDQLIYAIGKTKKPTIISTGLSNINEIKKAVKIFRSTKNNKLSILHCTATYPPMYEQVNLRRIQKLNQIFNSPIGFSDHLKEIEMALVSIAYGCSVIEKHFTLNKKLPGWDHHMSINPFELEKLVKLSKLVHKSLGNEKIVAVEKKETKNFFRRSIVAKREIKKNEIIKIHDLDFKRPGSGIPPGQIKRVLNKAVKRKISYDQLLKLRDLRKI